jgi:hypothetical protein
MLEKILGFAVADVNYNWPENAMAIAKGGQNGNDYSEEHKVVDVNLLAKVTKGANEALNRDEAAQIIFNALLATDVVKSTTTGSGNLDVDGNTKYAPVANRLTDDYRNPNIDKVEQLLEKYFPKATLDKKVADKFGRTATVWKVGNVKVTDEVVEAPDYTYTTLQTKDSVKADLDGYDLKTVKVYKNGVSQGTKDLSDFKSISTDTGNGTLVEAYTNDKGSAIDKIVIVQYEPAKVTYVNSEDSSLSVSTSLDNKTLEIKKDTDKAVFGKVSSAAVKDIILVAVGKKDGKDTVLDAYIPEEVKGAITKSVDSKEKDGEKTAEAEYVVDGTNYIAASPNSKSKVADSELKTAINKELDVKIYLDEYGFIKLNDKVDAAKDMYILFKGTYPKDKNKYGQKDYYAVGINENGEILDELKVNPTPDAEYVSLDSLQKNRLYAYKETADGYVFADDVGDGSKSEPVQKLSSDDAIKANPAKFDNQFISKDVKTVTITDKKGNFDELKASIKDGTPVVAKGTALQYRYVVVDNEITTVFSLKDKVASDEVIYLTGKTESTEKFTRDSGGQGTAEAVEAYKANSQEAETIYILQGTGGTGFYSSMEEEGSTADGTIVYSVKSYSPTTSDDVQIVYPAKEITSAASNGVITVDGKDFMIKEDAAIRDLRENPKDTGVAKIESIEALIDDVQEEDVNKNTMYKISVAVAYEEDSANDTLVATQVYITDIVVIGSTGSNNNNNDNEPPKSDDFGTDK